VCLMYVVFSISASPFFFLLSFFLLVPSNIEYLSIEHLTYVEKKTKWSLYFFFLYLLWAIPGAAMRARNSHILLSSVFLFFRLIFFSIRITTVHTENQNIKKKLNKQKLVFFLLLFRLCSKKKQKQKIF